ncbi:MAG: SusD/RagB family nutrient-binding outer membrane lipoprotein [Balneolales bacterium]
MSMTKIRSKCLVLVLTVCFIGCNETLTNTNINPNGVSPETANASLLIPKIQRDFSRSYTDLGEGHLAGVVQHMQEDGWFDEYNLHEWIPNDWNSYYGLLRNNKFVYEKAVENDQESLQGISLTMKSLIFGHITDLWGDAPYSEALRSGDEENAILTPKYDSQEDIYRGVLADLKEASALFEEVKGGEYFNPGQSDILFNGDMDQWHAFANSLILRFSMRLSEKLPDLAENNIKEVYDSGIYLKDASDDVAIAYNDADTWPTAAVGTDATSFRRRKFANTFLDKLVDYNDPRLEVWVAPVHVRWVEDTSVNGAEGFIHRNGEPTSTVSITDEEAHPQVASGAEFTRRFNPNDLDRDTREYVGLPPGIQSPDSYNGNPTPGQTVQNQHVSQMGDIFREPSHELLKSRVISAAEVNFILAEAAQRGWGVGNAEEHYNNGVQEALNMWNVGDQYGDYIAETEVAYDGTLEQIMEQKYLASFLSASEAWFDYRRTGLPELEAGPASAQAPALPVRFRYGDNELDSNSSNVQEALERLEETNYSVTGANSAWSKPWLLQGTDHPW